jgi:HEAT repeat protein
MAITPQHPSDLDDWLGPCMSDGAEALERCLAEGRWLVRLEGEAMMRTIMWIFLAALLLTHTSSLADADQLRSLINDLRSADTQTRLKAIKGLGESGDIRALSPLLKALHDERGVVRQHAIAALQRLAQTLDEVYIIVKRWLQALIHQLRHDPPDGVITATQWDLDLHLKKA